MPVTVRTLDKRCLLFKATMGGYLNKKYTGKSIDLLILSDILYYGELKLEMLITM